MPRGQYDRSEARPQVRRTLKLNPYQRDGLVGTVKSEITRVTGDSNSPRSLRLLALKELNEVLAALEAIPGMDGENS